MKKSKWTRLLSVLLALVMALSMNVLSVFAAGDDGETTTNGTTITIKGPKKGENEERVSLAGASAKAYLVLVRGGEVEKPETSDTTTYTYTVASDFENFFKTAQKSWQEIAASAENVYIQYNETDKRLTLQKEKPDAGSFITISVSDSKLETGNGFAADLISRLKGKNKDLATMANWLQRYAEDTPVTETASGDAKEDGTIEITLDTPGYYLIVPEDLPDGVVMQNAILKVVPGGKTEIDLKADTPDHDKQVKNEEDEDTEYGDSATGEIGDTLNYKLTYEIPAITTTGTWNAIALHDTLTNQKVVENSFELTVTNETGNSVISVNTKDITTPEILAETHTIEFSEGPSYTVPAGAKKYALHQGQENVANLYIVDYKKGTQAGTQEFYLELTETGIKKLNGEKSTLTLTYDATLTEDAVQVNGNEVEWVIDNGTDTNREEDKTEVYTYGIRLKKEYSGNEDMSALIKDTIFELYRDTAEEGNLMKFVSLEEGDGRYRVATKDDMTTISDLKLDTNGTLTILGLDKDTSYVLVEKQAPSGYEKIDNTIITLKAKDAPDENVLDGDECTIQGDDNVTKDGEGDGCITSDETTQISLLKLKALNQKGFDLPGTGGAGTWMFTLGGIALIVLAGGVLITASRRKPGKK